MIKNILKKLLRKVGFELKKISIENLVLKLKSIDERELIELALSKKDNINVVVGAHDLISFDFLGEIMKKYNPKTILFEPREESFKSLKNNISQLNLSNSYPYQLLVHPSLSKSVMYSVKTSSLEIYADWASGIASVNKKHLLQHIFEDDIEEITVNCISPDNWHSKLNINEINFLQIDCEGFDFEILKAINIPYHSPAVIKIEIANLRNSEKNELFYYLQDLGYDCIYNGEDIIGFKLDRLL